MLAILPLKGFGIGKQRLASAISAGSRQALVEAMYADVLVALRRARRVHRTVVVTGDPLAQQLAAGYGASFLPDSATGHSAAALRAIAQASAEGEPAVLLVPGDCPLLSPRELDALIERERPARSAAIVPDRHGTGTNALLIAPPDALEPAFGPGSRSRHAALAAAAGTAAEVVEVPSLALDVDTPEDLDELQRALAVSRGGAAHTRGMLRQLGRSRNP